MRVAPKAQDTLPETFPVSLTSCLISFSYGTRKWTDYFGIQDNVNSTPTPDDFQILKN